MAWWLVWWGVAGAQADDEIGMCGYRAVLFAAQSYADPEIGDLETPNRDIELVASVLRDRFGFATETVPDATRAQILDRLERLQSEVTDCDAVVLYYAGHGELDERLDSGFWLPVDARLASKATWISNDDVASRVRALPARHVMLIADSCFAGSLFRGLTRIESGGDQRRAQSLAARRSRTIVTSGGEEPVADQYQDSGASVFAYFLHQSLSQVGARYVTPDDWFADVRDRVMDNAHQQPQLGRLFGAGHEGGTLVMVDREVLAGDEVAPLRPPAPVPPPAAPSAPPPDGITTSEGVSLVAVEGGSFLRGSGQGAPPDERPQRTLTVGGLEVMRSEVTQALFERVLNRNPSEDKACGPSCPVERVTFLDAVTFANALSEREGLSPAYKIKKGEVQWRRRADGYRLLTEAEWEYVANAGTASVFAGGPEPTPFAWTAADAGGRVHPVCTRRPNALGLCDLSGNVAEWVWDWYAADAYLQAPDADPTGPGSGTVRVVRGGAFDQPADDARIAARDSAPPSSARPGLGFRLARPAR